MSDAPKLGSGEEMIRSWLEQREANPELAELNREMFAAFGGAKGVAAEVRETYDNAPEGSNTRALLLKSVIGVAETTAPKAGQGDPLKNLKPEEITEMAAAFERMKNTRAKESPANG